MEEYKDKASFEEFFKQNYVPLDYKSIRNEMREMAGAFLPMNTNSVER